MSGGPHDAAANGFEPCLECQARTAAGRPARTPTSRRAGTVTLGRGWVPGSRTQVEPEATRSRWGRPSADTDNTYGGGAT